LYLQGAFVKEVEVWVLVWAFTLKQNQPIYSEAERCTSNLPGVQAESESEIELLALAVLMAPSPIARWGSSKRFASNASARHAG